jgi:hypothetical protein
VELIPPGHLGVGQLGVELCTADPAAVSAFYQDCLGFQRGKDDGLICGRSALLIRKDAVQPAMESLRARGFRYLTVQILQK